MGFCNPHGNKYIGRRADRVVLQSLRDPDANVRFWACYAAAHRRLRRSIPLLRGLLKDKAVGNMGWTVGYEAGEALKALHGRQDAWDDGAQPKTHPHAYECLWRE